jgi:hypothetical protein
MPGQSLSDGGNVLLGFAWGRVTLVDLYGGFFVTAVWILTTERPWWLALFWLVLLALTGNVSTLGLIAWRGWRAPTLSEMFVPQRR